MYSGQILEICRLDPTKLRTLHDYNVVIPHTKLHSISTWITFDMQTVGLPRFQNQLMD